MAEEVPNIEANISVPSPAAEVELEQCEEVAEIENFEDVDMQSSVVILPTAEDESLMNVLYDCEMEINDPETVKVKRGRGRPRKYPKKIEPAIKRPRGRPRMYPIKEPGPTRKRGRPRLHPLKESTLSKGTGMARGRGRPRIYPIESTKTSSDKHSESDLDNHSNDNPEDYAVIELDSLGELSCEAPSPKKRGRPKKQLQATTSTTIKKRGRPKRNDQTSGNKFQDEHKPAKASLLKGQGYEEVESHVKNSAYKRLWRSDNRLAQKPAHCKNSSAAIDTLVLKRVRGRPVKRKRGRPKRDPDDFSPMIKYNPDGTPARKKPLKLAEVQYNPDGSVKKRPRGRPKKEYVHCETEVKNESASEPKKRGRPKKSQTLTSASCHTILTKNEVNQSNEDIPSEPRKRGRPRKSSLGESAVKDSSPVKRGRGRPKKTNTPAVATMTNSKDIPNLNVAECGDNIESSNVEDPASNDVIPTDTAEDTITTTEETPDVDVAEDIITTTEETPDGAVGEDTITTTEETPDGAVAEEATVFQSVVNDSSPGEDCALPTALEVVVNDSSPGENGALPTAPEVVVNDSSPGENCALPTALEVQVLTTAT